jgi:cob(I)alamin adenosyltransferase
MTVYTRKGDGGRTGLWGGHRLDKDDVRVEAIGAVDECNAAIGVAAAAPLPDPVTELLAEIQDHLFVIGCELMAPDETGAGSSVPRLSGTETGRVEAAIDELDAGLPELRSFIHPTGTPQAANLHLARTVCRRAERRVTTLRRTEPVSDHVPAYLNRLADLLFVLARHINDNAGILDHTWAPTH